MRPALYEKRASRRFGGKNSANCETPVLWGPHVGCSTHTEHDEPHDKHVRTESPREGTVRSLLYCILQSHWRERETSSLPRVFLP